MSVIKTLNDKTYYQRDSEWFGTNKNGDEYKVIQPQLLKKLNTNGLGDSIGNITAALGIEECEGCKRRKELLNSIFPWSKVKDIRQLTGEELDFIASLIGILSIDAREAQKLFDLYNNVFYERVQLCSCPGLVKVMIERLDYVRKNQLGIE